jgi:hypothetical protein
MGVEERISPQITQISQISFGVLFIGGAVVNCSKLVKREAIQNGFFCSYNLRNLRNLRIKKYNSGIGFTKPQKRSRPGVSVRRVAM